MKITNRTFWKTEHLRAFATRVAAEELDPEQVRELHIEFTYKIRRGWRRSVGVVSGRASLGGRWMKIFLPTGEVVNRPRLAHTLAHEMAHIRGMGHKQMRGSSRYDWGEGWEGRYAWADSFPLEAKVQPVAATLGERRGARLEHARAMLKSWERRSRLAAGKLRRWRGHVRDLEKLLSAAAEARTDGGA